MMPGNATDSTEMTTYRRRTADGLHPSHSAMPPQTPAMILYLFERRNGMVMFLSPASTALRRYGELHRWLRSDRHSCHHGCAQSAETGARIPIDAVSIPESD